MLNKTKAFLAVAVASVSAQVFAIPQATSDAMTAQVTEVGTYVAPAIGLAVAVALAFLGVKWTKKFISKAS